jgi:hypothetical protein
MFWDDSRANHRFLIACTANSGWLRGKTKKEVFLYFFPDEHREKIRAGQTNEQESGD